MKKMFRKSCISLCMLCLMLFCTRNVYAAKTDSLTVGGYAGEVNDSEKNGANSSLLRSSVKLDNTKLLMYPTQTKKLIPYSAGNKVSGKWKSSNKSVVSVSSKGKLTAKKAGTATITVTVEGTSATCKVTVKNPSLKLGSSSLALDVGKSKTIKAAATGISNKITWSSSNKSVATVNSSGKVTAKKAGSCTITAKANGITAKCSITVKKVLTASDKNKIGQLIHCFDVPVGFLAHPKINIGKRPSGLTQAFMAACSAWSIKDKYCSEIPDAPGYGAQTIKGKYVTEASKRMFGKSCSISSLPKYKKPSYLLVGYDKGNVIRYLFDAPIWPILKIRKIEAKKSNTFDVTVRYSIINQGNGKYEDSKDVVFTIKYDSESYYGFYVTKIRFS